MSKTKNKLIDAGIWNLFERTYNQILRFGLNIYLARLLFPSDYGLIGMIAIFLAISQSFIEGGFINALIQKQDRSEEDFSTTFYFNISAAIILYTILFILAPIVSSFYHESKLTIIMRVITISILLDALSVVPRAKLAIKLDFKKQAAVTSIASTVSGILSIIFAYKGMGVWALVFQSLLTASLSTILLSLVVQWYPKLKFSIDHFNDLFRFGSKLLISNLIDRIFRYIYYLIIGKFFSIEKLGYYTRAEQFSSLPSSNIAGIIQSVTFPKMCEIQSDIPRLRASYRRSILIASYFSFPILLFISFFSIPIITVSLTDKWLQAAPFLKLLCFVGLIYPINFLNINLLLAKSRTDLYLQLELIKKFLIILMLIGFVRFGIYAIIYGQIAHAVVSLYINSYYSNKLIQYGFLTQLRDIFPLLLISLAAVSLSYIISTLFTGDLVKLLIGFSLSVIIYITYTFLFNTINIKGAFSLLINK